jgi:molybdate transport system substrate-binding protein
VGSLRLAVADPRLAPYGAAALQVLDALGVREAWAPRLVQGESVAQAWKFVASGNVELGLVARSQVESGGRRAAGSGWLVPASLHSPIRQDAVLLARGRERPAALALLEFLRGAEAHRILAAHGYER